MIGSKAGSMLAVLCVHVSHTNEAHLVAYRKKGFGYEYKCVLPSSSYSLPYKSNYRIL